MRKRPTEKYILEKVEAYTVALDALEMHEPADGDVTGIARKLRMKLHDKLDREIQRWVDSLPPKATKK